MLSAFLPIAITLTPFLVILLIVYLVLGKKVARRSAIIMGIIFLVLVVSVLFFVGSSSEKKSSTTTAGEKIASQVVQQEYPGAKYSVVGKVISLSGETYNQYRIQITANYDEASYKKFNKDVCKRLNDDTAHVVTTITKSSLDPQQGMGGTCRHRLETN